MKIPAGTYGERSYRIADGDLWVATKEVCRDCLKPTPDGVDVCVACVRLARAELNFGTPQQRKTA